MSRFSDYEASAITPQFTLLKKLNAILKYLRLNAEQGTKLYKHILTFTSSSLTPTGQQTAIIISTFPDKITTNIKEGYVSSLIFGEYNGTPMSFIPVGDLQLFSNSGNLYSITITSDEVEPL